LERYREESQQGKEQAAIAAIVLAVLLAWLGWQTWFFIKGTGSIGGILYVLAFFGLWAWRCAFRYTYVITDSALEVVTAGWGLERKFVVALGSVGSFATRYHKKFFRQTGIKKYIYRYSSSDPRPTRILVYSRDGKLQGLLFKVSDEFIGRLAERLPDRMLDLEDKNSK
jgi:hypothetical protein